MLPHENLSLDDMEGEVWKPILGYEGLYEISNYGRIKSLPVQVSHARGNGFTRPKKEKIMKQVLSNVTGYLRMCLCKGNVRKGYQMHRLIAIAFIPNPENKLTINHKNGVKHDNSLGNLEWATNAENNKHKYDVLGHISGRKGKLYKSIYKYTLEGELVDVLSDKWDADPQYKHNVQNVCLGYNNSFDGHTWSYAPIEKFNKKSFGQGRYQCRTIIQKTASGDIVARYESSKEASCKTGISRSTIFNSIWNNGKLGRGYYWCYE